jgi:NADH-quinone oxidoreductase subunit L
VTSVSFSASSCCSPGAGTTSISVLLQPETLDSMSLTTRTAAVLLLVAGSSGQVGAVPLHTWLPDAMEGPTPVSALIHAATMVAAGGYVLARLLPLVVTAPAARATLAVIASISMLGAALVALAQSDLKRVLAWSTISQVAYLLGAWPSRRPTSARHRRCCTCCRTRVSRLCCSFSPVHSHTRCTAPRSPSSGGSWRRAPVVTATFTIGLASLAGLPPMSGFWSKEAVLGAAEETALHGDALAWAGWLVLVAGLLTGVVTAAYATRTWLLVVPTRREVPADVALVSADGGAERGADGDLRPPDVPAPGPGRGRAGGPGTRRDDRPAGAARHPRCSRRAAAARAGGAG